MFEKMNYWLQKQEKIVRDVSIIDGSLIDVPIQRNTREENMEIKE
jgi:hypothetical protein